jgi:hypothetical protein
LWDAETGEKFEIERYRHNPSAVERIYEEVRRRVFEKEGEKV